MTGTARNRYWKTSTEMNDILKTLTDNIRSV